MEEREGEVRDIYFFIFCFGNALLGIGATAFHTLGPSYIHDNTAPESRTLYLGIYCAVGGIGPMVGFLMAALFLSFPESAAFEAATTGPFIGAWWPGLFIGAILVSIGGFLMAQFPSKLLRKEDVIKPSPKLEDSAAKQRRQEQERQLQLQLQQQQQQPQQPGEEGQTLTATGSKERKRKKSHRRSPSGDSFVNVEQGISKVSNAISYVASPVYGLFQACVAVFSKKRWLLLTTFNLMDCYASTCFLTFGPKYIETMFSIDASAASVFIGGVICPAAAVGVIFAGFFTRKFHLRTRGQTNFVLFFAIVSCLSISLLMLMRCPSFEMVGFDLQSEGREIDNPEDAKLARSCNANCKCHLDYDPVCGADGKTFFNPCLAGCLRAEHKQNGRHGNDGEGTNDFFGKIQEYLSKDATNSDNLLKAEMLYTDCGCVKDRSSTALTGRCGDSSCGRLPVFLATVAVGFFAACSCYSPVMDLTLGSVDEAIKSVALGIQSAGQRLLAHMPVPIILGNVFDSSCLVWNKKCEEGRNCLQYDRERLPLSVFGFTTVTKLIGICCVFACVYFNHVERRKNKAGGEERNSTPPPPAPFSPPPPTPQRASLALEVTTGAPLPAPSSSLTTPDAGKKKTVVVCVAE